MMNLLKVILSTFMIIICLALLMSEAAYGTQYFNSPVATNTNSDYMGSFKINGVNAQIGDEVAFFDGNGTIRGHHIVNFPGQYGLVHVYGGDTLTSGSRLYIKVWDASINKEVLNSCVMLSEGDPQGSEFIRTSSIPPIWQDKQGFALDIDTISLIADINDDCSIDLTDALLVLRITGGLPFTQVIPEKADVNEDYRIGLQEVVYILQHVAELH